MDYRARSTRQWFVILATAIIIFTVVLVTAILLMVRGIIMSSEPYKHAIMLVERDPAVMRTLGEGYRQKGLIQGSLSSDLTQKSGRADFSFKLEGQNGVSKVAVSAFKKNDVWMYETVLFYPDANGPDQVNLITD